MKSDRSLERQPSSDRNHKIASIITLLITISAKIEKIKQKLCGFSPNQFSPQCIFQALDLTSKGYLDLYDIRQFLGNQTIKDKDIILLFIRCSGNISENKLTYLGYLNLLKPYFNAQLARDLIKRDTILMKRGNEKRVLQTQETVLLLLNQLILLSCVCIAEHEELKQALMDEYMLNILQLSQILGLQRTAPLKAIHEFIDCNSSFDVEQGETKYLLSYLKAHQYDLIQQNTLSQLFMPTKLAALSNQNKTVNVATARRSQEESRLREKLHTNYNKTYIGKQDLFTNTNKLSFLNYIHPNSIQPLPQNQQTHQNRKNNQNIRSNASQAESNIAEEHKSLGLLKSNKLQESYKLMKKVVVNIPEQKLDQSVIQASNVYAFKDTTRKLNNASQAPLYTPILERFMHQSNIRKNMGHYNAYPQNNELNTLLQERSNMSESEAFVRPDSFQQSYKESPLKKYQIPHQKEQAPVHVTVNNSSSRRKSRIFDGKQAKWDNPAEKSQGPGILSQFIRGDLT